MRDDPFAPSPPAIWRWTLRLGLPPELAEAVSGDLEEEYRARARTGGRLLAALWIAWQAISLRRGALRRAARRLTAVQPTWERSRPGRARLRSPGYWSFGPMTSRDLRYAVRRLAA